jgi:UDP-N-acetylmuramate dehydrogenase
MVHEGGPGALSGCGERNPDGEDLFEEFDLEALNPRLKARLERQREEELRLTIEQKAELASIFGEENAFFDIDMSLKMASGIGSLVEAFSEVRDPETLKKFLEWASERNVDYRFLGSGSKSLIRDGGVRGVLIRPLGGFDFVKVETKTDEDALVSAGPAKPLRDFLEFCAGEGFSGLEGAYPFGGTMGGALFMNLNLGSLRVGDFIDEITVINREGRELTLRGKALRFENAGLKLPKTACVVRIVLRLKRVAPGDASSELDGVKAKHSDLPPDGKNCIVGVFRDAEKTKASDLICDAGLSGVRIGGARVMPGYLNAISNEGKATFKNVTVLMNLMKDKVKQTTGISLEPAVKIIGDRSW